MKLKSESRVKLFYLDPDAQVRAILFNVYIFKLSQGQKMFDTLHVLLIYVFACLIWNDKQHNNNIENPGEKEK